MTRQALPKHGEVYEGRVIVYVSGPLESGPYSVNENVRRALQAAEWLWADGYLPHVPHLTTTWDAFSPHDRRYWLELDLAWVKVSGAVLRLPGASPGAQEECELAEKLGIPVVELNVAGWESRLREIREGR